MANKEPYQLSASLEGHSADVRCVSSSPLNSIVFSSSRDGTARSWIPTPNAQSGSRYSAGPAFPGQHDGFLNACCWIAGPEGGYLVTGGQDKLVAVWPLPSDLSESSTVKEPSHLLVGHEGNVCAIHASQDGRTIVSGSWDKTARVWKDFQLLHTLRGHDQAVWAVLSIDAAQDQVLTGAADNIIRLWRGTKVERVFKGHTQPVRALARLGQTAADGDLFASAGNDASIRLWSLKTGEAVHVLNGHDSFVYSLSPIPDALGGGLVSGGEDRTIRIWRASDGECEQTIVVPAISVWSVACLENGDIATGSSDSVVRIFTRAKERTADAATVSAFEKSLASTAINKSQIGDVKKSDLPGPEALANPGKKEGQVIMVKGAEGNVEAHQWSSATQSWQKIGEVVDAVGSGRKQLFDGQEYDYVFDIDVGEGMPNLKLPYNVTQNPYEAAQKFLIRNELSMDYINQIVEFIDKNTGGTQLGQSEFVDPYTGASRYTGGSSSRPSAPSTGFSGDPFTGGGRRDAPSQSSALIPHTSYLSFSQANLAALRAKIGQLNEQAGSGSLSPDELANLDQLIARLLASSTSKSSLSLSSADQAVLVKLVKWTPDRVFPALDLIRLVALSSSISDLLADVLEAAGRTDGPAKEVETNSMLALRALANALSSDAGRPAVKDESATVLAVLDSRGLSGLSKNGKVALATVLLNLSILAYQGQLDSTAASQMSDMAIQLLDDQDSECVYRTLIAVGNLVSRKEGVAAASELKNKAKQAGSRFSESRIQTVVHEIEKK